VVTGHTATLVGERLFVIGGQTTPPEMGSTSQVYILDTVSGVWKQGTEG